MDVNPTSSYHRLLVHRCSAYYRLAIENAPTGEGVILYPTADSKMYVKLSHSQCLDSRPAWKRLINPTLLPRQVIALIKAIFMSEDEVKMIFDLREYEAQTFVNAIHKVCFALFPSRSIT